jgi:hypothetical protein
VNNESRKAPASPRSKQKAAATKDSRRAGLALTKGAKRI